MLKIVVFDSGWGGDLIGDYLERELPIKVERVIDWKNGPYSEKSPGQIMFLTEEKLRPYIGDADVIVLTETATALTTIEYLRRKYPEQAFVGYGWDLPELIGRLSNAMILTSETAKRSEIYQRSKAMFSGEILVEPECRGWERKIDNDDLPDELIEQAVGNFRGTILVYNPIFIDIEPRLRAAASEKAKVIDMRRALLRDVCLALKLRGVDGYAPRDRFREVK